MSQLSVNDSRVNDSYADLLNRIKSNKEASVNLNILGSPYFEKQFKKARVISFGKTLDEPVYARYNANTDELEVSFNSKGTHADQSLLKNTNIYCVLEGVTYKYLPLYNGSEELPKIGYVNEVYKGQRYSLYLRQNMIYREGKKAVTSLERSFPPRYVEKSEWYLQKKEGPLRLLIPKNKNLKQLFNKHSSQYQAFLKTHKGSLKDSAYLKKIIQFMDEFN